MFAIPYKFDPPEWVVSLCIAFAIIGLIGWIVAEIFAWRQKRNPAAGTRDWNIQEALRWWSAATGKQPGDEGLDFFDELRQIARDGLITIWGRPNSHGLTYVQFTRPQEPIPAEHWRDHELDNLRYIFGDTEALIREATSPPGTYSQIVDTRYSDLRVSSADIKSQWPKQAKGRKWRAANT